MGILSDQPLLAALARGERWPRWRDRRSRLLLSDKRRQREEGGTGEMRHGWGQARIVSWGDFQIKSWTTGSIPRAIPRFGILNCANT